MSPKGIYYNDSEPFVCTWLRNLIAAKLLPAGDVDERLIQEVMPDDVRDYTQAHFFAGIGGWAYALQLAGWGDRPVWTGSCPCQPFSAAGQGKAEDDPRHLWPEWFRLIRECRPVRVFGEQVANGVGKGWWDVVSTDLEAQAYTVGSVVLGAHSVGAPHLRQRIWWVADTEGARDHIKAQRYQWGHAPQPHVGGAFLADAYGMREPQSKGCEAHERGRSSNGGAPRDATGSRSSDGAAIAVGEPAPQSQSERPDWWTVEPALGRLAHGIPARMGRLRAYGNAIVPQVAAAFVSAYMECAP